MQRTSTVTTIILLGVLVLVLAGCGDSTPLPADAASTSNYTPSTGSFAAVPASSSGKALAVNTCNLDAVNDKPAGSESLPHASTATFSGWAASGGSDHVPANVQLVLKGAQDYAVNAATGMPRPDVASANKQPGWAGAGYSVKADLSAVAPGSYTPVLEFNVDGKPAQCATQHKLTIQ
ncbi:MAG TPA: hypothetical protein VJQ42_03265 [Rhodanobacteraceae bacterium]|nr:hypothetical protein [Rhodanobacteraceae bacterium]